MWARWEKENTKNYILIDYDAEPYVLCHSNNLTIVGFFLIEWSTLCNNHDLLSMKTWLLTPNAIIKYKNEDQNVITNWFEVNKPPR